MNMITRIDPDDATVLPADALGRPKRRSRWQIGAAAAVPLALAAAWSLVGGEKEAATAAPPPPTVSVATPLVREISELDEYVGRFEASNVVEVRPRVSGAIVGVHFKDGDIVRKGQLLFTIDARPFAAALGEAQANVASARSALALAQADLRRAEALIARGFISVAQVDSLRARVQGAQAALAAAGSQVSARALNVEFAQVRAPISGRISDRRVDAGNLVTGEGGSATLLTTINALDPIHFSFDGSEALFLKAKRAQAEGATASPVEIRLQDQTGYRWKGRLDFTDNGLDPRSGTIRARAVVGNPELFLTPGMFGNMRLSNGGATRALLVPDAAVQTDQARKLVLVVAQDGTVAAKPVELGPVVSGLRAIRSGISPADRIVVSGTQFAAPGTKVHVRQAREPRPTRRRPARRATSVEAGR